MRYVIYSCFSKPHKELMGSWTVSHGETILNCAANYWYYYPEPDCYTRTVLSRLRDGHSVLLPRYQ